MGTMKAVDVENTEAWDAGLLQQETMTGAVHPGFPEVHTFQTRVHTAWRRSGSLCSASLTVAGAVDLSSRCRSVAYGQARSSDGYSRSARWN